MTTAIKPPSTALKQRLVAAREKLAKAEQEFARAEERYNLALLKLENLGFSGETIDEIESDIANTKARLSDDAADVLAGAEALLSEVSRVG